MAHRVTLSAGTLEYEDTGSGEPTLVFLHGLLMDPSLWEEVVDDLKGDHRCIVPSLPLGAHRQAIGDGLSFPAVASFVSEFLEQLELSEVTLIGNDTGGAIVQLVAAEHPERLAGIGLVSCDAFDNFPPGLTGKAVTQAGRLPPALFGAFMQQLRFKPLRRSPIAFGWLTKRGDPATRRWLEPVFGDAQIRGDAVRILRSMLADRKLLIRAADSLASFDRPALIVWASEDRVMPPEHGRRLAELLPASEFVEVQDSYTLIPLDQPRVLADHIRRFTAGLNGHPPSSTAPA